MSLVEINTIKIRVESDVETKSPDLKCTSLENINSLDDKSVYTKFFIYDNPGNDPFFDWHLAGQIKWIHVDIETAIQKQVNIYDFCVQHGVNVSKIYSDLHKTSSGFIDDTKKKYLKPSIAKILGQKTLKNNLAFIDRFEILPKYRGRGIGKMVYDIMLRQLWQDVKIIMLYSYPLQFTGHITFRNDEDRQFLANMRYCDFNNSFQKSNNAVLNFYKNLGFHKLRNSDYIFHINKHCKK